MLFRTVYGPELAAIYRQIRKQSVPVSKRDLVNSFMPQVVRGERTVSAQNIEDALSFLYSCQFVYETDDGLTAEQIDEPFALALLKRLRQLENGERNALHVLDPYFMRILDEIVMRSGTTSVINLHKLANHLEGLDSVGGLSKEKIQAWKRVMGYLGVGYRSQSGFLCMIRPELILAIMDQGDTKESSLQHFLENVLAQYLPYLDKSGDLALPIQQALNHLEATNMIRLSRMQDAQFKHYFRPRNLRWIERVRSPNG